MASYTLIVVHLMMGNLSFEYNLKRLFLGKHSTCTTIVENMTGIPGTRSPKAACF